MKILLISYGSFEYDGRLRELYKVADKIGCVYLISRGKNKIDGNHYLINNSYLSFIKKAVSIGKQIGDVDVLFLDNRKSIIPGLKLKKIFKKAKIVLDCRELYLFKYVKHLSGKIGCLIEKKGIKKADVIICANEDRAVFMKDYYRLEEKPLVYENLRMLEYSSSDAKATGENRFKKYIINDEIRIIATSGCDISRLTDVLVTNMPKVNHKCRLFLVGSDYGKDFLKIQSICQKNNIRNVVFVEKLGQDDLKALISFCHIGIVNYHQNDLNNKYCASGKLFEFVFEGLPIVATTNPPLQKLCSLYSFGVCDDSFWNGINTIISDYETYKTNALNFSKLFSINDNNNILVENIKYRL